jgi:hypothetical protein
MTAAWTWVVGPWSGGPQYELTRAKSRKATFNLVGPSSASFTLNGRDPLADKIEELVTDLHLLRAPNPGQPAERLYRGRVGQTRDQLDAEKHTLDVSTADYRAVLDRRRLWAETGPALTWTQIDQGQIVADVIGDTQIRDGGNLGITVTGYPTGILRDRTYESGDSIGEKIQELSEVINGFDWDVIPRSASALELAIFSPSRGGERGVILQPGGLIASATRTVDPSKYANAIRLTGQTPSGSEVPPAPQTRTSDGLVIAPEGRWDGVYGEDITSTTGLEERADWRIADSEVVRPSYTVRFRPGRWRGPGHIWLGDTVRLVLMSPPRLRVDTSLRVQTIDVAVSDDGDADVSMTIGAPPTSFARRATEVERRLATLERR